MGGFSFFALSLTHPHVVMPGLDPGIHAWRLAMHVDGRVGARP